MSRFVVGSAVVLLTCVGCVSLPSMPSIMVLPGKGVSFSQFHYDDGVCQNYAYGQIEDSSFDSGGFDGDIVSAIFTGAIGATVGALIGGRLGAAIGAGTGLAASAISAGAHSASRSSADAQQRYDYAYIQCMYAKGHQVPVSGSFSNDSNRAERSPAVNIPPPPPGYPPSPPAK